MIALTRREPRPPLTEAERVDRAGRIVNAAVWAVAGIVMVFSAVTAKELLELHEVKGWSAWLLAPAVDIALCAALYGERLLTLHDQETRWGRVLRLVTALMTLVLNTAAAVGRHDWLGAVVHSFAPVLLVVLTEFAQELQLTLGRLVARQAREQEERRREEERLHQAELDRLAALADARRRQEEAEEAARRQPEPEPAPEPEPVLPDPEPVAEPRRRPAARKPEPKAKVAVSRAQVEQAGRDFREKHDRLPSRAELVELTGCSEATVDRAMGTLRKEYPPLRAVAASS